MRRLDADDAWCQWVAGEPSGDGWRRFDQVLAPDSVADAGAEMMAGRAKGLTDVAGSYLASELVGAVIGGCFDAFLFERRVHSIAPSATWVHQRDDGWIDGVAAAHGAVRVLADDPLAAHPDAVIVDSIEALRTELAEQIVDLCTAVFAAVRDHVRYGLAGMWGSVADDLGGAALFSAQSRGVDADDAWAQAQLLTDEIARLAPRLKVRPRHQRIDVPNGSVWHQSVRGTCCLAYKVAIDPDPAGNGYCTSCPLRPDDVRAERVVRWRLSQEAGA